VSVCQPGLTSSRKLSAGRLDVSGSKSRRDNFSNAYFEIAYSHGKIRMRLLKLDFFLSFVSDPLSPILVPLSNKKMNNPSGFLTAFNLRVAIGCILFANILLVFELGTFGPNKAGRRIGAGAENM
jgi:hypothetical protein